MAPHSFGKLFLKRPLTSSHDLPLKKDQAKPLLKRHITWRQCVTISRKDIEKVAVLARIRVDDEQVSALEKDLGNILDLVDQLGAADTDAVQPMAHPLDAVQRLRADEVTETNQRESFQAIAPATENGLYLVPRVIE
jgi:aspartyl-tRNA(Asn)/glutamyl-tRNA(Gln) amidotransferase subunit C